MLRHHFKITWRNIIKNKATGMINLLGLTLGLMAAMLIGIYVYNEWQTDRWIPHADRTFRLIRTSDINNNPYTIGITSPPFAPTLKTDFPEDVAETMRVIDGNSVVKVGDQNFQEDNYYYADPNFLTFFDLPLLHGDAATALKEANSIVLTLETAKRYFGDEKKALGKTIKIDDSYDAQVTGILAKLKHPTHLNFDLVESTAGLESANWWTGWWNNMVCTYFRLNPKVSAETFASRLPAFMDNQSGFISTYYPFGTKKNELIYRLTDEYSLFYLQFMETKINETVDIWKHLSQTQTYKVWSGYAFESICLKHLPQIKKGLSIGGVYALASTFYKKGNKTEKGTQIDLILDRNDHVINLFEIKFYKESLSINKAYAKTLREKMLIFRKTTKTRKQLFWTLLTTFGLQHNEHSLGLVDAALDMNALFE